MPAHAGRNNANRHEHPGTDPLPPGLIARRGGPKPPKITTKTTGLYPSKTCKTKIKGGEGQDPVLRCPALKGFDVEVSFSLACAHRRQRTIDRQLILGIELHDGRGSVHLEQELRALRELRAGNHLAVDHLAGGGARGGSGSARHRFKLAPLRLQPKQ